MRRLPLRLRLLLAPLLGLALILAVSVALVSEARRQNELLTQVAERDLAGLDRYTALFVSLAEQHTAIFDLLDDAQRKLDEAALYDRATQHLDRIRAAVGKLEGELQAASAAAPHVASAAHRATLLEHTRSYGQAAASAIEFATVDAALAGKSLAAANERFVAMNQAFTEFLSAVRREIGTRVAEGVEQNRRHVGIIVAGGLGAAALLVLLSVILSRLLTRSLEAQLAALTELGDRAGARLEAARGNDQIARIEGAIAVFRDLLLKLEERVRERTAELSKANAELRVFSEVVRSTGEAVAITRPDGSIIDVNPAFERVTGYARAEILGSLLFRGVSELSTEEARRGFWKQAAAAGGWSGELLDWRKSGEAFSWWATINAVRGEDGGLLHLVSVARDVTELKRNEQQLQKLAFYDPLTGLANRALLDDRLRMALTAAKRAGSPLAVIYVDLDRFKYVNDTLGHPAGDQLLVEIARRLAAPLRASDTVARMGGDEFTVLLTEVRAEADAINIAERIIDAVSKPVKIDDNAVFVGASVGVSFYPRDGEDAETLRKNADVALYEAKQAGRGQYCTFDAGMLAKASERLSLSVQIDAALQNDEFSVVYQTVVGVQSGQTEELEALVRWRRADGRLMSAATFIPHAEESGLVRRIDAWVLEHACAEVAASSHTGRGPRLSVNISPVTLRQPGFAKELAAILQRTGFAPGSLKLELSETAVIARGEAVETTLREIAALGVTITLDDFGTGYSALGSLAKLPVNALKIDRSFIETMLENADAMSLVQTIISLAHSLELMVVAEGVETEEQEKMLRLLRCDQMQGYRISRPVPIAQIASPPRETIA